MECGFGPSARALGHARDEGQDMDGEPAGAQAFHQPVAIAEGLVHAGPRRFGDRPQEVEIDQTAR